MCCLFGTMSSLFFCLAYDTATTEIYTYCHTLSLHDALPISLHLDEEDQRILISVAQEPEQTMRWFKEALLLPAWANAPQFQPPEGFLRDRFDEARAACRDYCGEESFEIFLLERGIASSHGQMRSEEHTSELQSLMSSSYAVFCLKKKKKQ